MECRGVVYRVELGDKTVEQDIGKEHEFYIYTHVRESELRLFGFENAEELSLFEMLIDVSGVGPKVGISLVSQLGKDRIVKAICQKDPQALKIPGVGIKTANKIVLELSDKLKKQGYEIKAFGRDDFVRSEKFKKRFQEATDALGNLGYTRRDIEQALNKVRSKKDTLSMTSPQLVKYLLSNM